MAEVFNTNTNAGATASAGTVTINVSYSAGDQPVVWLKWDGQAITATVSDPTNGSYTQVGPYVNQGSTYRIAQFVLPNAAAGNVTITATFSSNTVNRAIAVSRGTGTANVAAQNGMGQGQAAPGTGTDAVTTGNGTATSQPNCVVGMAIDGNAAQVINVGTGFTDLGKWTSFNSQNADESRCEYKRTILTGSLAATWTLAGADVTAAVACIIGEAVAATFFPPRPIVVNQSLNAAVY